MQEIMGEPAFILRFLQCRDEEWIGKVRVRVLGLGLGLRGERSPEPEAETEHLLI